MRETQSKRGLFPTFFAGIPALALALALLLPAGPALAQVYGVILSPTYSVQFDPNAAGDSVVPQLADSMGSFTPQPGTALTDFSVTGEFNITAGERAAYWLSTSQRNGLVLFTQPNGATGDGAYTLSITPGSGGGITYSVNKGHDSVVQDYYAAASFYSGAGAGQVDMTYTGGAVNVDVQRNASGNGDLRGSIYGFYNAKGPLTVNNTAPLRLTGNIAASGTGTTNANGSNYAAYAANGPATVSGKVEISNLTRQAANSGTTNSASANGIDTGVYAYNEALAKDTVTLRGLSRKAEITANGSARAADASGSSIGAQTVIGTLTAQGPVLLENLRREAATAGTGAANAYGDSYGLRTSSSATAEGPVTLAGISHSASITNAAATGNANAFGDSAGLFNGQGASTAKGAVRLENIHHEAANAGTGAAAASGSNYGVYAYGPATAEGPVTLSNISHSASITNAAATGNADASGASVGVFSLSDAAWAKGAVLLDNIRREASTAGTGTADAGNYVYGVYAGTDARAGADVRVSSLSVAGAPNGTAWQYGLGVGLWGGESITLDGGQSAAPQIITAQGTTYAFALQTGADPSGDPHTTAINGPVILSAAADSLDNNYVRDGMSGARPVSEAEYLGLGAADTLNFNLGAGQIMDNGGNPLRVFGAETVNFNSGILKLAEGSYFINQKDFDTTPADWGKVTGPARTTALNVNSGAVLWLDGEPKDSLAGADGAHQTRFSTADSYGDPSFTLEKDYNLDLNLKPGGELRFTVGHDVASGGPAVPYLHVSKAALQGKVTAVPGADFADIKVDNEIYLVVVATAKSFDATGATLGSYEALFFDYAFGVEGNKLVLRFLPKNGPVPGNLEEAARLGGGSGNSINLARALDNYRGGNATMAGFISLLSASANPEAMVWLLNQAHGESTASAVQYFAFNMKNLFRVVDNFAMTPGDDIILGGGAALDETAPAAGDGDYAAHPGQPWRVKLRLTGDWGSMDGHDGYYGYDGRSFGGALALERDVMEGPSGRFTLGFAGAFSHSEVDFDNYDNAGDSDDWAMAVYGRYQYNDWFAGARVGYGRSAASVERNLPTLGLTANSNPDLDYYSAALFTGYDFYFGDGSWRLTPVAGVNWLRTNAGSFDEVGAGDYNLSYDADNYDSLELLANVTLAKRIELSNGSALTPRINAGIGYETADNQVSMKSTFGDIPDFAHFGVDSPDVGRARLLAGAGIDWHVTDHVDLSLEYQGSFQEDYDDHMGLASFKVSW